MPQKILNRNEILEGPSPAVKKSLHKLRSGHFSHYFEGYHGSMLDKKISAIFDVPRRQISIGYGIEFFLRAIFDSLDLKTDTVLTHDLHYSGYGAYAKIKKVRLAHFKTIDRDFYFTSDIEDCLEKMRTIRPKVVLLTSPNNPTGHSILAKDLARILGAASKNTLVVLDEAYHGFDTSYDEKKYVAFVKKYHNFVVLRSFSKKYALAGARIGFALWGKNAKLLARYEDLHLGGSKVLEKAALAALGSENYYKVLSNKIIAERTWLTAEINKMKYFKAYDSKANFLLVKVKKNLRQAIEKKMRSANAVIAKFVSEEFMRVSIAPRKYTRAFLKLLKSVEKTA